MIGCLTGRTTHIKTAHIVQYNNIFLQKKESKSRREKIIFNEDMRHGVVSVSTIEKAMRDNLG